MHVMITLGINRISSIVQIDRCSVLGCYEGKDVKIANKILKYLYFRDKEKNMMES